MCGFVFQKKISGQIDDKNFSQMLGAILHRGPDGSNIQSSSDYNYHMGHNRLAILDLDARSDQPMNSLCKNYKIVFNGEIYNFKSLKENLINDFSIDFMTEGDTEVILQLYINMGVESFKLLEGMYAFVIYDEIKDQIVVVRDPHGVKPLYYYENKNEFIIASELVVFKNVIDKSQLDMTALTSFLVDGFIGNNKTPFLDVKKFEPGTAKVFCGKSLVETFSLKLKPYSDEDLSLKDALSEGVKSRFVADVPVGIFLSGGVDSTLVANISSLTLGIKPICFTLGLIDDDRNEADYAKVIAKDLNLEHKVHYVNKLDIENAVKELSNIYDEPFGDISAALTLLLSRFAKKYVKVVVSADGGDEFFLGYKRQKFFHHPLIKMLMYCSKIISPSLKLLAKVYKGKSYKLLKLQALLSCKEPVNAYRHLNGTFNHDELNYPLIVNNYENVFDYDLKEYMPNDIFYKVDRATMSSSIEGREPLMHKTVFRHSYKFNNKMGFGKTGLISILKELYPKYNKISKSGFSFSLTECNSFLFEANSIDWDWMEDINLLKSNTINRLKNQQAAESVVEIQKLYFLFVLSNWKRKWEL